MTCICGIGDGKNVWVGGDTFASDAWSGFQVTDSKVFLLEVPVEDGPNEKMLIGGCGSFRMLQLLEHAVRVPQIRKNQGIMNWLTVEFMDSVRHTFIDKGFAKAVDHVHFFNGSFLLGFRGYIYLVEDSYQVLSAPSNMMTAGSGASYALASMVTTRHFDWTPRERITRALEVAAELNLQTNAPFTFYEI